MGKGSRLERRQGHADVRLADLPVPHRAGGPVRVEPSGLGPAGGQRVPRAVALGVGGRWRHRERLSRQGGRGGPPSRLGRTWVLARDRPRGSPASRRRYRYGLARRLSSGLAGGVRRHNARRRRVLAGRALGAKAITPPARYTGAPAYLAGGLVR